LLPVYLFFGLSLEKAPGGGSLEIQRKKRLEIVATMLT
jgi:hypothetical protein